VALLLAEVTRHVTRQHAGVRGVDVTRDEGDLQAGDWLHAQHLQHEHVRVAAADQHQVLADRRAHDLHHGRLWRRDEAEGLADEAESERPQPARLGWVDDTRVNVRQASSVRALHAVEAVGLFQAQQLVDLVLRGHVRFGRGVEREQVAKLPSCRMQVDKP
jgi:hypothetical protein